MTDDIDPGDVLDVLSDEYARTVLETLGRSTLTAPEIAGRCGFSEATVYRRLDELERSGLVTAETEFDPDGHHRSCYRAVSAEVTLSVCSDGLDGTVSTGPNPAVGPARRESDALYPAHRRSSAD